MADKDLGKTSTGVKADLGGLLCYLPAIGWIIAIVFFVVEKENKFVRFHALQSILLTAVLIVLSIIPFINFLMLIIGPLSLILLIVLMIKAYQGEKMKLPVIGDLAEKKV